MKSRDLWAATLKSLREKHEDMILGCITNLVVTFTESSIIIHATTPVIKTLLEKHKHLFPEITQIKLPEKKDVPQTIEQKLEKIFGDKLTLEK